MDSLTCRCCLLENVKGYNLSDYSEQNDDNLRNCGMDEYCINEGEENASNNGFIGIDHQDHDENRNSRDVKLTYSELFTMCTNIKSDENDKYSKFICYDCCEELNNAYKFRRKCEISNYILCLRTQQAINQTNDVITFKDEPILIESVVDDLSIDDEEETIESIEQQTDNDDHHEEPPIVIEILQKGWQYHQFRNDKLVIGQEPIRIQEIEASPEASKSPAAQHRYKNSLQNDHDMYTINNNNEDMEEIFPSEEIELESNNKSNSQLNVIKEKKEKTLMITKHFNCEQCQERFPLLSMLTRHIAKKHEGQQRFLCNICGKLCSKDSTFRAHLISHQAVRTFKCNECDKSYFSRYALNSHISTHKDSKNEYLCLICGKGFKTNPRLKNHMIIHNKGNFECEFCQKMFRSDYKLRSHVRVHTGERPYKCDECGLRFTQTSSLRSHKRIHTGERPYACKFCDKRFSQHSVLNTHLSLHTGKEVKCPDCNKMFSRSSQLVLHRRGHTGETPYICELCPNRYKQQSHLARHMDTHLGIKHTCDICNKQYSKQWSLKLHMYTHSTERPFSCETCGMTFIRRFKYSTHLKQHEDPTIVDKKQMNTSGKKNKITSIDVTISKE